MRNIHVRRALGLAVASLLSTVVIAVPQAATAADPLSCNAGATQCIAGSRLFLGIARDLGVADKVVRMFGDQSALPAGVPSCTLGATCDWWPAIATGLRASANCADPDLWLVCDQLDYGDDPTPIISALQVDVVLRTIDTIIANGVPDYTRSWVPMITGALYQPDPATLPVTLSDVTVHLVVEVIAALLVAAPDAGPSARESRVVLAAESDDAPVLVDPQVGALNDVLLPPQKKCAADIETISWLDYSKEGFSNDILLRAVAGVDQIKLTADSAKRGCPVPGVTVDGSMVIKATSNASSGIASRTKDSGLQSRTATLMATDGGQPKLVPAGPYYEWTTAAFEIAYNFPFGFIIHMYRAPAGDFGMEASIFENLLNGYRWTGGLSGRFKATCTKKGNNPDYCVLDPT